MSREFPAPTADWFIITSGEHEGRPHLRGWHLSAIKGEGFLSDDGWLSYAVCPRCHAMVTSDAKRMLDRTWDHEQWHAETDFPIPALLLALVDPKWARS